jgi:hypothetical protein
MEFVTQTQWGSMVRSLLRAASLTGYLLIFSFAPPSMASEAQELVNVGFVLYTKSDVPGTLKARWNYANAYSGLGEATGGPLEGFARRYHVRYFFENGEFSDEYDLIIEKTEDFYDVAWIVAGKVGARGVGMEVENGLAVGWTKVSN